MHLLLNIRVSQKELFYSNVALLLMWFHIIIDTTIFFKALALLHQVPLVWHHFTRINDFCRILGKASYFWTFAYYELGYE